MRFVDIRGGLVTVELFAGECFTLAEACMHASEDDDARMPLFDALTAAFEAAGMVADLGEETLALERRSLLEYRARYGTLTEGERARLGQPAPPAEEGGAS